MSIDFWNQPVIVAVVGAFFASALAAIGYLLKRRAVDKSDLRVYTDNFEQIQPLIGDQLKFKECSVYCESVRFDLVVSHNQKGTIPIRIKRVEFIAHPVNISGKELKALNYKIDASAMKGFGIVDLGEYVFRVSGSKIEGQYLKSRENAQSVEPSNVFHSTTGVHAFDIIPQKDPTLQISFVFEAASPGLYKSQIRVHYDIAGTFREQTTSWAYIFMKQ